MHRKHVHISYFCSREPTASALCHLPEIRPKSKRCTTSTSKGPRCPFLDWKHPERQLRGYLQFSTDQSGRGSLLIRCCWNAVVQLSWREQGLSSPVLFALLPSSQAGFARLIETHSSDLGLAEISMLCSIPSTLWKWWFKDAIVYKDATVPVLQASISGRMLCLPELILYRAKCSTRALPKPQRDSLFRCLLSLLMLLL